VGVPLQIGDDMLGVLSLGACRPAAFGPGTAEELAPFARIAALLLRRAREDEQRQARFNALEREAHEGLAESLHELKAPLHAASGFLELVVDEQTGPLNDLQKDFLQTARAECARLKDAITSLMEVSSSASRRPLALARIEPGQLVSEVVQRMRGHALARNLQLVIDADPTADTLEGDPAALSQVLTNLLQNAFRVAPVGSQVVVRALRADGWTHFVVDDEGPGVPDGELTSIFERFVQAEPGRREPGQVGLGLAISRRIVEAHNGRIWAENRDNGGARFCFAVPRAAAESRFADTGPSQSPLEELRSTSRSWADGAVGRSARAA
jgi:signal transduction histidine kinase